MGDGRFMEGFARLLIGALGEKTGIGFGGLEFLIIFLGWDTLMACNHVINVGVDFLLLSVLAEDVDGLS